jgi:N-acetylmuramoyl-L-alanine amidase
MKCATCGCVTNITYINGGLKCDGCFMKPEAIVLHHSLTKDSKTVSWGAIRRFHTVDMGWRDIGYHLGIELARDHHEIFMGRMLNDKGAHCPQGGMNTYGLGICFVGNFDLHPPAPEMWDMGIKLVKSLMDIFNITTSDIYGHRAFNPRKSCPGKMFDVKKFRRELK